MPAPDEFPADHELMAFFGVEPRLLDPDVPWFYNSLDFELERKGVVVQCQLKPSYGDISVRVSRDATELVRLHLQSVKTVSLIMNAEGEILVATIDREFAEETFCLMLEPRVWVGLGPFKSVPPGPWPYHM